MIVTKRKSKETAREYAFREIKQNIISLQLEPGSTQSTNELAKELGISRTPVREALLELNKLNLVEVYPQIGCAISLIDWKMVEEAVFLRRVLEIAVAESLCETITDEELMKLEQNIQLQEFYLDNSAPQKIMELDNEFHMLLFRMCNKECIFHLMEGMQGHFDRVRVLSLISVKEIKIIIDHKAIVNALRLKDKELVKEFVGKHLSRYRLDYEEMGMKYADYFVKESEASSTEKQG
jgi:DNA-binding GntR family transcriptional regulator